MAKAAATTKKSRSVDQLREAVEEATARRDALERELALIGHLKPQSIFAEGAERPDLRMSRSDVLRERAREPQLRAEFQLAEADVLDADHEFREAQEAERAALSEKFRQQKAPLIARLAKALDSAAAINQELVTVEEEERCECGSLATVLISWPELATETATVSTRLGAWKRFLAQEGYRDV